jgi:WD40 repeat protein
VLTRATYSPHEPFGSLLATGGLDGKLGITDMRLFGEKGSMPWSVEKAHDGVITDVSFNQFVPYWIATAGGDGGNEKR